MAEPQLEVFKPTADETKIIKRVENMFQMGKRARKDVTNMWREAEKLYAGLHWDGMNMPNFKNQITVDLIASAIDTMVPILSDRPPKIDVMAVNADDESTQASEILQALMKEVWEIRDMQNLVPDLLLDYLVYGTGIMKLHWNNNDDLPDCDIVDPFAFYINPSATKLENAEWVIYSAPVPLYEIKHKYTNGKYVRSQAELDKYEAYKIGKTDIGGEKVQVTDTKGSQTNYHDSEAHAMESLEERALVIEAYMRDTTKEYIKDDNGKEIKSYKYPNMMKMCTIANGVLLYEGPSKYPFFSTEEHLPHPFPFITLKNVGGPHSFWGKPEPKRLKSLNLTLDRLSSQIMDNIHLTANPMWIVDETSSVTDQISNKPGQVIRKKGPGQVAMQSPSSMPGYVFNFYQLIQDLFETVSGVNKATQGKDSSNVTSGVQAQIYRQASTTKLDFKARTVEKAISTLGQMWIAMFKNLGTKMQMINYVLPDGMEEMREVMGISLASMNFQVRAKTGSMLPENKQFVENKILQLAQLGILQDSEYIIENMEMPGKERLLKRMREQAEAQEEQGLNPSELGGSEDEIYEQLRNNPELMNEIGQEYRS